mgnify:CR=1 FL=1
MSKPNPNGALVCCVHCSRDTRAKDAVCGICRGGYSSQFAGRNKGTKTIKVECEETDIVRDDYHGDIYRDDL